MTFSISKLAMTGNFIFFVDFFMRKVFLDYLNVLTLEPTQSFHILLVSIWDYYSLSRLHENHAILCTCSVCGNLLYQRFKLGETRPLS